jgi:hypothetical protein
LAPSARVSLSRLNASTATASRTAGTPSRSRQATYRSSSGPSPGSSVPSAACAAAYVSSSPGSMRTWKYDSTSATKLSGSPASVRPLTSSAASCPSRNSIRSRGSPLDGRSLRSARACLASADGSGSGSFATCPRSAGSPVNASTKPSTSRSNRRPSRT